MSPYTIPEIFGGSTNFLSIAKLKPPPILFLRGHCGNIFRNPWLIKPTVDQSVFDCLLSNNLTYLNVYQMYCTTPMVYLDILRFTLIHFFVCIR